MNGSEWWANEVPDHLGDDYTSAILEAIRNGHAVFEWQTVIAGDLEFQIMRAPLAIGCFDDHVFLLGLSAEALDMIAAEFAELGVDMMVPTPHLYDLAATHDKQVQIGPHTLPSLIGQENGAAGMTKRAAKAHADAIAHDRPESCSFISACCKTYGLHPHPDEDHVRDGYACEQGWRLAGKVGWGSLNTLGNGWVVQKPQWAHLYRGFFDYSMGGILVHAHARKHGVSADLRELARGPQHSAAVAPAGPVPFIVHPDMRAPLRGSQGPATDRAPLSVSTRPLLHRGSKGEVVAEWQRILMADGFDLAPYNDDGGFGKLTHNATVGWKSERGLPRDGVVDADTWAAVGTDPIERAEPDGEITDTVLCRNYTKANRTEVDNVVIHTIEITEASTSADRTAAWGAGPQAPRASWNYAFDDDSTIMCVPEKDVAWAAPGLNRRGVQFEHSGYARQTLQQWQDPFSRRMLARSSKMCAAVCTRWNIPIKFIDAAGLLRGERGITTHYQVTRGPGKGRTDHSDPGRYFPMSAYLDMVQEAMA